MHLSSYMQARRIWPVLTGKDAHDPHETKNIIRAPAQQQTLKQLNRELFSTLEATDGMYIPWQPDRGEPSNLRRADGSKAAEFPPYLMRTIPAAKDQPKQPKDSKQ